MLQLFTSILHLNKTIEHAGKRNFSDKIYAHSFFIVLHLPL